MKSAIIDEWPLCAVVLSSLLLVLGCSGPDTTVAGKVVYDKDGSPVTTGMVMFVSIEGQHLARGDIQSDGTFSLRSKDRNTSIHPGKYGVCIVPPDTSSQRENGIIVPPLVDARFLDTRSSGLEFEVQPGENNFTLTVSKPTGG